MKVSELIEHLKNCELDCDIFIEGGDEITYVSASADEDTDGLWYTIHVR